MEDVMISSNYKHSSNIIPYSLLFFILSNNPFIQLIPIKITLLFVVHAIFTVFLFKKKNDKFLSSILAISILYLATNTITSIYNNSITPLLYSILAIISYFSIVRISFFQLDVIVQSLTKILCITALLAVLALLLSTFTKFYFFKLGDLYFFPFSLMGDSEKLMRPSGFMYEPGQLSFYICLCVSCREFLGLPRKTSIIMILAGMVTQSLAHFIFIAIYFLYILIKLKKFTIRTVIKILPLFVVALLIYEMGFFDWAFDRALLFINDPLTWPRFISYSNVLSEINGSILNLFFGPSKILASRELVDAYGENILTPIIYGGLLASWPYYFFILFSFIYIFRIGADGIIFIGIALLTFQRPYTLEFPYSLSIGLLLVSYRYRRI
jgi:hypothetical protein